MKGQLEDLEWGQVPHTSKRSDCHGCENEECKMYGKVGKGGYFSLVVAVKAIRYEEEISIWKRKWKAYSQCPECGEYFWNHILVESARELKLKHSEVKA